MKIGLYAVRLADWAGWLNFVEPSLRRRFLAAHGLPVRARLFANQRWRGDLNSALHLGGAVALALAPLVLVLLLQPQPWLIVAVLLLYALVIALVIFLITILPGSAKGGVCLPAGSRIDTGAGSRAVETLQPGDDLLAWDLRDGATAATVLLALRCGRRPIVELRTGAGAIRLTASHALLTARGWVKAAALGEGDRLLRRDGAGAGEAVLLGPPRPVGEAEVFCIVNSGPHTNLADGFILHNFTRLRAVRGLLHRHLLDPLLLARLRLRRGGAATMPAGAGGP